MDTLTALLIIVTEKCYEVETLRNQVAALQQRNTELEEAVVELKPAEAEADASV